MRTYAVRTDTLRELGRAPRPTVAWLLGVMGPPMPSSTPDVVVLRQGNSLCGLATE